MASSNGSKNEAEIVRVLLVEDDEDDFMIIGEMLADQDRVRFSVDWCSTYDDALVAISEQRHDVYLIDYRLGERTGLELVRQGFASRPQAPVIMVTGQATYEIDLEASALGVTDFVVKQHLDPTALERSVRYAISFQKPERFALAVRGANDGIWDWDLVADRIYFSSRWQAILGQPEHARDEPPSAWFARVHSDDLPALRSAIATYLDAGTSHLQCEHRLRHADGTWRWVMVRGLAIRGVDGKPIRMAGSLSDITDRHVAQVRLRHDALHDTLTGLPNRSLFVDRVNHSLRRSTRDPSIGCASLFIDIDRFKMVNDSLSHAVGDALLVAFAERVATALRPGDTVARLGGDEFTVLLENVGNVSQATIVADRILGSVSEAFQILGNELLVSASIGIALSAPGLSSADLMRNADIAMYDAKRRGRACNSVFDETMRQLDRSFVATISDQAEADDTIVCSAVALAHSLGLSVIAEGIERPDQLERLRSLGCEFGQGYLFSPAVSAEQMGAWLKSWSPSQVMGLDPLPERVM